MGKQITLRPSDIVVACQLAITPSAQFVNLAVAIGLSAGECHNAVRRLRLSHLLLTDERRPATELLRGFLIDGVPFAFPAMVGGETRGVASAYSSPAFLDIVESKQAFVWPHADGDLRGRSLTPLYPGAVRLPGHNAQLYELLGIVDALRVGNARIRAVAAEQLAVRLGRRSP